MEHYRYYCIRCGFEKVVRGICKIKAQCPECYQLLEIEELKTIVMGDNYPNIDKVSKSEMEEIKEIQKEHRPKITIDDVIDLSKELRDKTVEELLNQGE